MNGVRLSLRVFWTQRMWIHNREMIWSGAVEFASTRFQNFSKSKMLVQRSLDNERISEITTPFDSTSLDTLLRSFGDWSEDILTWWKILIESRLTQFLCYKSSHDCESTFDVFKTLLGTIVHHSFKSQFISNEFITRKSKSLITLPMLICDLNEWIEALGNVNWITMNALNHLWDDLERRSRVRLNSISKFL